MPLDESRKIRSIQICLIIFYAVIILYPVNVLATGLAETISSERSPQMIPMIVVGALGLIWTALALYATVSDKRVMLIISGFILIGPLLYFVAVGIIVVMKMFEEGGLPEPAFEIGLAIAPVLLVSAAIEATFVLVQHLKLKYAPVATEQI